MKRFRLAGGPNPAFVAAMEDVLDVYHRPYNADEPVVCFDECSKQLLQHVRTPIPAGPGRLARVDDEYKRCGTVNIFCGVEPLTGHVIYQATERRTLADCGHFLKQMADQYPEASRIILVCDNLNTHGAAALYAAFPPEQARQLKPDIGTWSRRFTMAREPVEQRSACGGWSLDRRPATK